MGMLFLLPFSLQAQIRDTVTIRGYKFLFAETEEETDADKAVVINLVRIQAPVSKWLLKHTLHSESPDCTSVEYELGTYVVSDSSIAFYTVWGYTSNALAGTCGVRKQTFAVTAQGKVKPGPSLFWASVAPQHPCLEGLETSQEGFFIDHPTRQQLDDQAAFMTCMEESLGGRFVAGNAQKLLTQEAVAVLAKQIVALKKKYSGFDFDDCF